MSRLLRSAARAIADRKLGVARLFLINVAAVAVVAPWLSPVSVQGAEDNFRMNMTGCQPDSASIRNDSCRFGGHGVFAKRAGATCRMICAMPKTNSSDQWDGLQLMGKDPDGKGLNYRIFAKWKKTSLGSTVATTLCSVDSNRSSSTGYVAHGCHPFRSLIPDAKSWYWLEVFITRAAGATAEIEVLGYDIF